MFLHYTSDTVITNTVYDKSVKFIVLGGEIVRAFEIFKFVNSAIVVLLTLAYLYQVIYMIIGLIYRKPNRLAPAKRLGRYGIFISARNEEGVIAELIGSLKKQNYPESKYDIFVLADNCTDETAEVARNAGAKVYERFDRNQVGKGYALDYLYKEVIAKYGIDYYDGFIVFDADNLVDRNFIRMMNRTFMSGKYDAVTCYRNSKNFGSNWLSASYSLWFLREARFVNYPRSLIGTSCMISGTGFLVSNKIMKENNGWPYHLLTEDIQFSVSCALNNKMIGYCDQAVVYDEQPTSFMQSWKQRLRWSKGFYQINGKYLGSLVTSASSGKKNRMSCYDVLMTVAPCMLLTIFFFGFNILMLGWGFTMPYYLQILFQREATKYLVYAIINSYLGMIVIGGLTVATEWKRIKASTVEKIKYIWMFPFFMVSYIPITLQALFSKVEWSPIKHYSSKSLQKKDNHAYSSEN